MDRQRERVLLPYQMAPMVTHVRKEYFRERGKEFCRLSTTLSHLPSGVQREWRSRRTFVEQHRQLLRHIH